MKLKIGVLIGLGFIALVGSTRALADDQSKRETITIAAGQIGPYYCPAGVVHDARIVVGEKDGLALGKHVSGSSMTLTGVGGGPRCNELAPDDPKTAANCLKLKQPAKVETKVAVVCAP